MWQRLPRWIWIGAWLLAFLAGMVNVIGVIGPAQSALTHMTGLTSRLAQGLAGGDLGDVAHVLAIMFSFAGGAALSGLIVQDRVLQWGLRYGVVLFLEAALLAVAALFLLGDHLAGLYLASLACGLQNAMASTFSGAAIRTTHVSGMVTDLGIFAGHALCRIPVNPLRLRICLSTLTGFCSGGVVAVLAYRHLGPATLFLPAALALVLACIYTTQRHRWKRAAFPRSSS